MRDIIQEEAVETALKHEHGSIGLPMRSGKTKIGLDIAKNFKKVLVSYPNQPIFNSWMEDSNKFAIPVDNVTFTTHISLNKHDLKSFDCVILD